MEENITYLEFKNANESEMWARTYYSSVISLDPDEQPGKTLYEYTGALYKATNRLMRNSPPIYSTYYINAEFNDDKELIDSTITLNNLLNSYSLPENIIVFRYTHKSLIKALSHKHILRKGISFTDKAFVSTTLCKELLGEFKEKYSCNCLLKIKLHKGFQGAFVSMDRINTLLNEQEFLLPPCTTFVIDEVYHLTNPLVIECTAILNEENGMKIHHKR